MKKNFESTARSLLLPAAVLAAVALMGCGRSHDRTGAANRSGTEPAAVDIDTFTTTDTVKSIDYKARKLTLQGPDGTTETYQVTPDMTNFNQIRVGDKVRATVAEALAVGVRKAGTPPNTAEAVTVTLAPKGARPGMLVERTTEATAKIEDMSRLKRTLTLAEVRGGPRTVKLAPGVDISDFKKGDDIVVRYTDAVALRVEKP
jgi:hypothetical protein